MDVHFLGVDPTDAERMAVDACLGQPTSSWEGAERTEGAERHVSFGGADVRARRHLLLPALQAVQGRIGWVSEGALDYICRRLSIPPAEAWGVATFYALIGVTPRPRRVLHVCDDIGCKCRGADELIASLEKTIGPAYMHGPDGDHANLDPDAAVWMRSPCLGMCDHAPAAFLVEAGELPFESLLGDVDALQAERILDPESASVGDSAAWSDSREFSSRSIPQRGDQSLLLMRRIGVVDPTSLSAYRATGGYQALSRALEIGREQVIAEVTSSKLMGRGGAAFPTGRKWAAVASQTATPHYVICNADESEPGTFKDRVLLEDDPFAIVEAMTIAGFATKAERGYVYIRGEYPLGAARIEHAINQARAANLLGEDILGKEYSFEIEVRRGSGAYICGEETAIFNSIEGYRGEPRNKPPFPFQAGLFGKPTLVNNVETLATIPLIVMMGGAAFASIGKESSTGPKLFCVSGNVKKPGVFEVSFGETLRQMIDRAGGVLPGRTLQAVLLGGAAGVFVGPNELDMPLTFEGVRAAKATLGSGVIMVFDDTVDMTGIVLRVASFFRDESCGQCVPCRVGTVRQEESLHRLARGRSRGTVADELSLLAEVGRGMTDASICGLGQTAYSAVESAVTRLGLFNTARART